MTAQFPVPGSPPVESQPPAPASSYGTLLRNPKFRALWGAQILSQTALNSSLAIQLFLIERVTQSAASNVGMLLAFNLPAVFFSALAGVIVDRQSKKRIMFLSNGGRIVTQLALSGLAFVLLQRSFNPALFLWGIYLVTFFTSAIGQIFSPAEGGMIPLIVGKRGLLASNSLFTITFVSLQAGGLLILGPLAVKIFNIVPSLLIAAVMYVGATALVWTLPRDTPAASPSADEGAGSAYRRLWAELRAGWGYALSHRGILLALAQISLVGLMVFVLAAIGPGFASRVLNMAPEDAVYVFWPAALGLVVTSFWVGRFGARLSRNLLASIGLFVIAAGTLGLGITPQIARLQPYLGLLIAACALFLGIGLALIQITSQTVIQEESRDEFRGRVLTVQFTLGNLIAVPPLLALGYVADAFGIPFVIILLGLVLLAGALANLWYIRYSAQKGPLRKRADASSR